MKIKKSIIMFIFILIFSFNLVNAVNFKTDLKLHFNFSQTTGNILNSANQSAYSASDYKISNRASTGKVGSGYKFSSSANDYIQMADHTIFDRNANDDMTMNVWVNMSNYAEASYLPSKCDFQTAWNREFCISVFAASHGTNPRKLSTSVISTKDSSGALVGQYISADNFPVKEWVMVSFVANSTRLKTYVNAVLVGNISYSGGIADDTGPFTIGVMEKTATSTNFNGTMDEVSLWSRTLSQNEINLLYNEGNGCDIIANPTGCTTATTQTPTPTSLTNTSNGYTNITLSWQGNYGSKYLIYRNGTNVVNTTSSPYTNTGLTSGTRYSYQVKAYNTTYDIALSNFSNKIEVRTLSQPTLTLQTSIIEFGNYTETPFYFYFNGTTTGITNYTFDCSLWLDYNIKEITNKKIPDIRLNSNLSITDVINYQGWNNLNVTCSNNEDSFAIVSRRVFIDTITPTITMNVGVNNSVFYRKVNTQLPYIFTYADDNLYKTNTTLCAWTTTKNECTQQISIWTSTSLTDDERVVNVTNLLSALPPAYTKYYIYLQAWDGHTAQLIEDYRLDNIKTVDKTGVKVENAIEITSKDATDITLIKDFDRYKFDVTLKQATSQIRFNLKSTGNLTYYPESEYIGHVIDFDNRKWIDFENENVQGVTFTQISPKEYDVVVSMKPQKKGQELGLAEPITFNSIGDLNYVNKYIYFNISNSSTIRAKDRITSLDIQNITVKIYTYPNTLIQEKSTNNYNVSLNITSGTYYINVSGSVGSASYITNVTANKAFSQNMVYTTYLTLSNSLYFFILDEVSNKVITGRTATIDVINYQNQSYTYTTSTGNIFQSGFSPGFYEINYRATNYTARSYYTSISGGDTQTLYLYLLNSTNIEPTHQYIDYDIVDESASPIPNATLKMQRYMITNNTWQTVEMSISNDRGQGFVFAEIYDATYRFIVEYPFGTTKQISSQFKLDGRDLFFAISLLDIGLTNYYQSGNVATTLSYSNTTKVWSYNFNAGSLNDVQQGRFLVQKYTGLAVSTICNTTVSSNSGGMTCNLTSYSNDDSTFVGQGFVTFTSDSLEYLVQASSLKVTSNYLKYGMNGIYLGLMIVGSMALIGLFSPVGSIILALFGLVITNMIGLMYLNTTWLIGIVIVGIIYIFSFRGRT